jgi:hypothetical protein
MEGLNRIKPVPRLHEGRISPDERTMGEVIERPVFQDIYRTVEEEGARYFPRLNAAGDVELYIVYEDIDRFSEQAEASVYLDFSGYKQKWIAVLWIVTDPENPLGYPFSFDTANDEMRYSAVRFLEQEHIWVHYMAQIEPGIIHLYSEAISFSEAEKETAAELLVAAYHNQEEGEEESVLPERIVRGEDIALSRLKEKGFSFYLDYSLLENRFGEAEAKEQVMGAIYRALWMMRRHPNAQAREAEVLLWVGEKVGRNRAGEETRLLAITMTPPLLDVFQIVHLSELEANPLATMLMSLTEYQFLEEEYPLAYGYIPIVGYDAGVLSHIEWEEETLGILAHAYAQRYPENSTNPYKLIGT